MKLRQIVPLLILILLALSAAGARASAPAQAGPPDLPGGRPPDSGQDPRQSLTGPAVSGSMSFFYKRTFGVGEVAYLADNAHLYYPTGVGVDGSGNLWVAETNGARAMKYNPSGVFMKSIGTAGFSAIADETHLGEPHEVAVDQAGNLWVADPRAARVVKFDAGGAYLTQLGVTGEAGTDNSHFDRPFGVAFDSAGHVYISDSENQRVQVFDSSGDHLATIGVTGVSGTDNAHFNIPVRIAIDQDDNLYVSDANNHRVQIFGSNHQYKATLGVTGVPGSDNGHFNIPLGVAVDASRIYVADSDNHRAQIFNRATRAYQATLGAGWGSGNNQFKSPTDVAVDADGIIYVADRDNFRVQKFNSGLFYRRTFGVTGLPYLTDAKHYNQPVDVAVDANGNIGILEDDGRGQRFTKLNASGVPQFTLGVAGVWGDDNLHFADPRGVAFDASGDIYVADCANHRLQIFAGNGAYQATFGGPGSGQYQFSCPTGVAFDAGGNMYVADSTNQRIQIYDSNRTYVATLGKTGVPGTDKYHFKWPQDVEVDAGGNIFVADLFNERVLKYNSSRVWQMTLGTTGESGCSEADHLCAPFGVAVDASGNIYVVQKFGPGVRVFSQNGDELATIGATWGSGNNQVREPQGIEVDADGNVYIADTLNHRVLKFVPGIPVYIPIALDTYP